MNLYIILYILTFWPSGTRSLNMNTILPIYYQIKQTIKTWIINREFNPGEKIPSENELAEKFGVSRLTVRQAIGQLTQEGFLISRRGEGTFVTDNVDLINRCNFEFRGLIDDFFFAQISGIKTKSVKIGRKIAPKLIREKLELAHGEKEVIQIKRARYLRDKLLAYSVNYLPPEIGMKINESSLYEKSLLQILEQDLRIQLTEAVQTIEAAFADPEVAEHLAVPSGSPVLFIERVMYANKRRPIEIFQSSYRGDMYKFIVRYKNVVSKDGSKWVHRFD
jgi:GntR family transcriptional regulator